MANKPKKKTEPIAIQIYDRTIMFLHRGNPIVSVQVGDDGLCNISYPFPQGTRIGSATHPQNLQVVISRLTESPLGRSAKMAHKQIPIPAKGRSTVVESAKTPATQSGNIGVLGPVRDRVLQMLNADPNLSSKIIADELNLTVQQVAGIKSAKKKGAYDGWSLGTYRRRDA